MDTKYIIIGGGLTGLTLAHYLTKSGINDFLILEGRNRMGGRILTKKNIDLGAAWHQRHHHHIQKLLEELDLTSFEQYLTGKSIIASKSGVPLHYFDAEQNGLPIYRIAGGSSKLIEQLVEKLTQKIQLETQVQKVNAAQDGLVVHTNNGSFKCKKAIVCVPPKLAQTIEFKPILPGNLSQLMKKTNTWMSNAIKMGLTFSTPFWRDKGFSGTVFGQGSPISEIYDHSSVNGETFALMGFVNEELRLLNNQVRKVAILDFLESIFGKEIREHLNYWEKDWSQDCFTSVKIDNPLPYKSFYGNELYNKGFFNDKLFFASAETSYINSGYMDGAIASGLKIANEIIENET